MYTVTFGIRSRSIQTEDRYTAVVIADALSAKGWLAIRVTDPDGDEVPWKV